MMKTIQKDNLQMLQFESFANDCNISHFITTRQGGISEGNYTSFNLGAYCGDSPDAVRENRKRLCSALGVQSTDLYIPLQTHETEIRIIDEHFLTLSKEEKQNALKGVDALLSSLPDIAIAVTTADCVPLLIYDPIKQVIGAVHAGWRGTVNRLAAKVVEKMVQAYSTTPSDLQIGIGPCIGQDAFEVGEEVVDAFREANFPSSIHYYNKLSGKAHIDLIKANIHQLTEVGVNEQKIELSGICTYTQHKTFYSARRLGINSGRFLTGILLNKKNTL
ncbi:peptidoglycan editing factor PgeF [Massilibacteroides sp.]|uniref:peptidoglycan editing factor PgeF n=1 Tax=Massilibacteroides sp. TaxID=2034766 RepID=UPI003445A07B